MANLTYSVPEVESDVDLAERLTTDALAEIKDKFNGGIDPANGSADLERRLVAPVVTALPASPTDGQFVSFAPVAAFPDHDFLFRYKASDNRWHCRGGVPIVQGAFWASPDNTVTPVVGTSIVLPNGLWAASATLSGKVAVGALIRWLIGPAGQQVDLTASDGLSGYAFVSAPWEATIDTAPYGATATVGTQRELVAGPAGAMNLQNMRQRLSIRPESLPGV